MKRVIPLALSAVFFFSTVVTVQAQPEDEVLPGLGLTMEEVKGVCLYAKDVGFLDSHIYAYSWGEACKAAQPDIAVLRDLKKDSDGTYGSDNGYPEAVNGVADRRQKAEELYELFTSDEFTYTDGDASREDSQKVRLCMTKENCRKYGAKADDLADIDPPITARTFPSWLSEEKANKMLPFFLISQNQKLRVEKYNELRVPLDEDQREKFCENEEAKERCANFEQVQKQLATNKTMIHALKGISDAKEFAKYVDQAREREKEEGNAVGGVFENWVAARDDSHLPMVLRSKHRPDGTVVPGLAAGKVVPADEGYGDKAKRLALAAKASAAVSIAVLLAWNVRRKRINAGEEKAKREMAREKNDAMADIAAKDLPGPVKAGEPGFETMGLSDKEVLAYNAWKDSDYKSLEAFLESKYSGLQISKLSRGTDSLLKKIQASQYMNHSK